jgi:hypothetical protein
LIKKGTLEQAYFFPFFLAIAAWIESITINMFFERDFIPSAEGILNTFGSKSHPGYLTFCIGYFIFYWLIFLGIIIELSK